MLEGPSSRSAADVVPEFRAAIARPGRARRQGKDRNWNLTSVVDSRARHVSRQVLERLAAIPGIELPARLQWVLDLGPPLQPRGVGGGRRSAGGVRPLGARQPLIRGQRDRQPQHGKYARGRDRRRSGATPHRSLANGHQGSRDIPGQLQGGATFGHYEKGSRAAPVSGAEAHDAELAQKVAELEKALQLQTVIVKKPVHEHMPRQRKSLTFSFRVADCEGYVTVGEFPDGRPGEVFISVSKQGSTLAGIMDAFAISVSMGLQHGVPLATFVRHFTNMRFEPAGMTDDPDLRFASSLVDYIFRRLAVEYMGHAERIDLGILTVSERMQPTLPGVEEAAIVDQPLWEPGLRLDSATASTRQAAAAGPCVCARDQGEAGGERCSLLLPVRGTDAASRQLFRLPVLWHNEWLLLGVPATPLANGPA